MGGIREFNSILNKSLAHTMKAGAWADYRKSVTEYAMKRMHKNGSTLIVGAGNMMDFDLQQIASASRSVTAADIDTESADRAISASGTVNVRSLFTDLGGLDAYGLTELIRKHMFNCEIEAVRDKLASYEFSEDGLLSGAYDNVLVSSLYTQLFLPQFLDMTAASGCSSGEKTGLTEAALDFCARLIRHVNKRIMASATVRAYICVWSDIFEFGSTDPGLDDIVKNINDSNWMDEFYNGYLSSYGHGLGSYGVEEISDKLRDTEYKWLVWPFNDRRTMVVRIVSGFTKGM